MDANKTKDCADFVLVKLLSTMIIDKVGSRVARSRLERKAMLEKQVAKRMEQQSAIVGELMLNTRGLEKENIQLRNDLIRAKSTINALAKKLKQTIKEAQDERDVSGSSADSVTVKVDNVMAKQPQAEKPFLKSISTASKEQGDKSFKSESSGRKFLNSLRKPQRFKPRQSIAVGLPLFTLEDEESTSMSSTSEGASLCNVPKKGAAVPKKLKL